MSATRVLVLRTAGTNCDAETVRAFERAGAEVELLHLNALTKEPERLREHAIVALPGGFSYGDDVAAGRVFGAELRHRLADELRAHVDGGGFALGICNGFQVLVELGLLEAEGAGRTVSLDGNASNRFESRWVTLRNEESACEWLPPGELWPVPVAHAEGRLVVRDAAALESLRANGQVALTYATRDGGEAGYPANPNGSVLGIAGLVDPTGRVLGLMPHPERNVEPWHHPYWTRLGERDAGEGLAFFERLVAAANA